MNNSQRSGSRRKRRVSHRHSCSERRRGCWASSRAVLHLLLLHIEMFHASQLVQVLHKIEPYYNRLCSDTDALYYTHLFIIHAEHLCRVSFELIRWIRTSTKDTLSVPPSLYRHSGFVATYKSPSTEIDGIQWPMKNNMIFNKQLSLHIRDEKHEFQTSMKIFKNIHDRKRYPYRFLPRNRWHLPLQHHSR